MSSPNLSKNQSTTSQVIHNHKIYTIGFIYYLIYRITQDNHDRDLVLRRKKEKSLDYNNLFPGEYKCSSFALDREERRDNKKILDHLKQDQTMLVIKRFSERKKVIIIESNTSCDHKPFQVTSDESSDHNTFQATSDESSDHNPFQVSSDDTLQSSSEDTRSSDSTWEQKSF
ncbi:hypothetical protein Tco_0375525 [Tanacetum coccineum]